MIKKYRKKPVEIEAVQWTGKNFEEIIAMDTEKRFLWTYSEKYILIYTLEGTMQASVGDYIIKGVQGEFYPCKPDIFEQTYDEVHDEREN